MISQDKIRTVRAKLRDLARSDLYTFCQLVSRPLFPESDFIDALHFRVLARALEKVASGETKRLLIAIPPRHGKSRFSSVAFTAWYLGRNPKAQVISASYGQDLAKDFAQRTREVLQSPEYGGIFPDTVLAPGGAGLERLQTTLGGSRLATSVQGVVTGKGADLIVIDDAMKAVDASSSTTRQNVYDWVKTTLMSRFDKPTEGAMVVIMQRLHIDDLIGRLKDDGGWTLLEMPGEGVIRQEYDVGHGRVWELQPGEPLFAGRFNHDALQQLKSDLGELAYQSQILQRPQPPGGALIKLKYFQRYKQLPTSCEKVVQSWDTAIVDNENAAYTVCTTWAIVRYKLLLMDVFRKRLDYFQIPKAIISLKEKHKARHVLLEVSGAAKGIQFELRKHHGALDWLITVEPTVSKEDRAMMQTARIERKRVFLPEKADWLEVFENEVAQFPHGKYADQVDSMVHFLHAFDTRNRITRDLSAFEDWPEKVF